jgi:hypothetical protein
MTDDHVSHGPVFCCHYGRSNSGGTLKRRLSGVCNAKADQGSVYCPEHKLQAWLRVPALARKVSQ